MKYDLVPKRLAYRNEAIRRMREEHPELALREIAEAFGLTRQRIDQILKAKNGKKPS